MAETSGEFALNIKQVNFTAEDTMVGRDPVAGSKKRITWTFLIGEEEHTVVLVWSIGSGKRQVAADGELIYEEIKKGTFFQFKWQSSAKNRSPNVFFHIVASSHSPPAVKGSYCQYEIIINGLQFSRLPHHDGKPLPELEGPGPYGIFDIFFPGGYELTVPEETNGKKTIRRRTSGGKLRKSQPGKRKSSFF